MSLEALATRALQRCIAEAACADSPTPKPHHELATCPPGHVGWTLTCDRPGCAAELAATGPTDSDARRAVTFKAEAQGWQISRWRDVPVDLCPEHREEGWAEGPPRTELEAGVRDPRRKR